ncbi:ASCH domain-containing protein [Lacticaseibacillus jixianensis]|uniref:ASCH domain-containing protein n=1 Tax=Lacticaseibacillus jixianensis TaxID=2486012 RepID=A0ABW4B770_9LACO|nr:ASCH domain-containing protein [Lacticaseibacillus jixianensis]
MKALSIRSDYVIDILTGEKTSEFRSWNTKHRGDLLICSTAQRIPGTMPGHALCFVQIVDVIPLGPKSFEWKFGQDGYYIRPFPVKGRQHLFNVDDDLIIKDNGDDETTEESEAWIKKYWDPLYV